MKKIAADYKGKHCVIQDELYDDDYENPFIDVDKIISNNIILKSHVVACRHYGIPAYIGEDQSLHDRIKKIEEELKDD